MRNRFSIMTVLAGGVAVGAVVGISSATFSPGGRDNIARTAGNIAISTGFKRQRDPQAGDYWQGCREARAAGTAPIYRGEPGYRSAMDGDDDGIACEPYRGQ